MFKSYPLAQPTFHKLSVASVAQAEGIQHQPNPSNTNPNSLFHQTPTEHLQSQLHQSLKRLMLVKE